MKKNNNVEPGKTFSVKVPVNADSVTLDFLNRERSISRNKLVYGIVDREAKKEQGSEITLPINLDLSEAEKERLLEPNTLRTIEVFIQTLIGQQKEPSNAPAEPEVDAVDISGIMDYQ
ncbi:hypothetical protein QMA02_14375 [Bacillus wiedmannii]|uniref:hypothetical protein n=1 Tax=Bacillus wiedmannii TaxID=1890302 RepID=UPI0024AE0DA3|nr:hypothetical protein [Bacillus wiedmannii]MDI6677028.1 hypothetical protein [Bacillus wiedmannii]